MPEPTLHHVQCLAPDGLHRMAYWQWGDPSNRRVLVCAHGLARQGRDFDTLARALRDEFRVVAPDVVGRGHSDWLRDPAGYALPTYLADMVTLLARLDADEVHWVGTSMGGLIGFALAALPESPLRSLVLNDVGMRIEFAALERIGTYLGQPAHWQTVDEAADALWAISRTFGPHTREEWLALTRPQLAPDGEGWKPHYDPRIAAPFRRVTPDTARRDEAMAWAAWDRLALPVLLLRGAESDLLSRATADEMAARGPRPRVVEFAGVGHAPTLVHDDQVAVVGQFLRAQAHRPGAPHAAAGAA